jgi:hypothetical protein
MSWFMIYATLFVAACRPAVKWYNYEPIIPFRQECNEWDVGPDDEQLCRKWTNHYTRNLPNGAYANRAGYTERCQDVGKASEVTYDSDVHHCLDSCPDGRDLCVIGKLAEGEWTKVPTEGILAWAANKSRTPVEYSSEL